MKFKLSLLLFLSVCILSPAFAQEFKKSEVEKVKPVRFQNRTNRRMPGARRIQEIKQGQGLAERVAKNGQGSIGGVTIRRIFDPKKKGTGADVISLGPKTNYGHINRIKRILSGYLIKSFNYTRKEADVLSLFVLYYNANNRGNMKKMKAVYSEAVFAALDPKKMGIGISYRDWPGKTQIVLPLKKNLARPNETDVKKEEIKDSKTATTKEKKEIKEVIKETREKDKKVIKKKIEETQEKKEKINKKIQELQKDPVKNKEKIEKAQEEKKQVEQKEEELKKQQEEIKKEEKKEKQEETAKKETAQKEAPKKEEGAKKQPSKDSANTTDTKKEGDTNSKTETTENKPQETAKDNKTEQKTTETTTTDAKKPLEKKEEISENVVENKILFMRVLKYQSGGHYNNELWWIEANKDDALSRSPYTNICSKGFLVIPDKGILVVGYQGNSHDPKQHQLVLLDKDKLQKQKESKEVIHWRTPLVFKDSKIYAILIQNSKHYLGRFNTDLTLDAKATEEINPNSDITFTKTKIYITGSPREGQPTTIRVFQRSDLKHLKTIDSSKLK